MADFSGRVTNQTVTVWSNGVPCAAFPPAVTTIEYPRGITEYSVMTDPDGRQTVQERFATEYASTEIIQTAGITDTTVRYHGGDTISTVHTTDGWEETTCSTTYKPNGNRITTTTLITNGVLPA